MKDKTYKIVSVIAGLAVAASFGIGGVYSQMKPEDSKSKLEDAVGKLEHNQQKEESSILDGTTLEEGSVGSSEPETEAVTDYAGPAYEDVKDAEDAEKILIQLAEDAEVNLETLNEILNSGDYTEKSKLIAVKNVAKTYAHTSNMLNKLYKEKLSEANKMIYLADQIESLEEVLAQMSGLKSDVIKFESMIKEYLQSIKTYDSDSIQKVIRASKLTNEKNIKELSSHVQDLRDDLQAQLSAQP